MIYRAIVGGGRPFYSHCLFFQANARDYHHRLKVICDALFDSTRESYHVCCVQSEAELMQQAVDPQAFVDAHLIEGTLDVYEGRPNYLLERDCLVFLTSEQHGRVRGALELAALFPGTVLEKQSLKRIAMRGHA